MRINLNQQKGIITLTYIGILHIGYENKNNIGGD